MALFLDELDDVEEKPEKAPQFLDEIQGPRFAPLSPTARTFSNRGLRNIGMRTKLGFAEGPQEKLDILRANGFDAQVVGNEIRFVDPKTNKLTTIDETGFTFADIADLIGEIPEIGGMTVGGIVGGAPQIRTGRLGSARAAGAAGAGLGGATGRQFKSAMANLFGGNVSLSEMLERIQESAITGAFADPFGRSVSNVLQKVAAPAARALAKDFDEISRLFSRKEGVGGPLSLTPAQASDEGGIARALDIGERVAESSFGGGAALRTIKRQQQEAIETMVDDMVTKVSRGNIGPEDMGVLVKDAIERKGGVFRTVESRIWGEVDRLLPDAPQVDMSRVMKFAQKELGKQLEAVTLAPAAAKNKAAPILQDMAELPDKVSFTTAMQWISNLGAKVRQKQGGEVLTGKEVGTLKQIIKQLNKSVDDAGNSLPGEEVKASYDLARGFTKQWKEIFENRLVKQLANAEPQQVAKKLFKPNMLTSIRTAKKAMGPGAFQRVKGEFLKDLFQPSNPQGIVARNLQKKLAKFGDDALKEIFDRPGELAELRLLQKALVRSQDEIGKKVPGGVAIQLMQPGAAIKIAQTVGAGALGAGQVADLGTATNITAGTVVFGPIALGAIMAHPRGIRWLTTGLTHGPKGKGVVKALSNMMAVALRQTRDVKILTPQEFERMKKKSDLAKEHEEAIEAFFTGSVPLSPELETFLSIEGLLQRPDTYRPPPRTGPPNVGVEPLQLR